MRVRNESYLTIIHDNTVSRPDDQSERARFLSEACLQRQGAKFTIIAARRETNRRSGAKNRTRPSDRPPSCQRSHPPLSFRPAIYDRPPAAHRRLPSSSSSTTRDRRRKISERRGGGVKEKGHRAALCSSLSVARRLRRRRS